MEFAFIFGNQYMRDGLQSHGARRARENLFSLRRNLETLAGKTWGGPTR
jgi:hypothetical protein